MISLFQLIKSTKTKKKLSVIILLSAFVVLSLAYLFIESIVNNTYIILILLGVSIFQIFLLQYFYKNQLNNEVKIESLNDRMAHLKVSLEKANVLANHNSMYLANMNYEIRTPLNTVLGMLNILSQTNLNSDQKAQVEIAEYSSKHLLQLVDMIYNNAEIESDDIVLKLSAVNLKTDLSDLFKIFEYQAWEKDLHFDYKFLGGDKEKFFVMGDVTRIQQILINLFNNAIKFTNTGKISIVIDQTVTIEDSQIVSFYINDTGIGLPPEIIKQIFIDSKNLYTVAKRDFGFGGLGLSISHKLINLMGGELKLESKEKEGTTFYFSLPLKKTLNIKLEPENLNPVLLDKFSVLVAEDNRMNQKVIKFLLEQQGADCTFAKNGSEAVELYKILDFNMIFMDIYMPDMDGYQATKAIKATDKYAKYHTPIIAVSARVFEEDIANAKLAGIDNFLAKPIDVTKLRALIAQYA